MDLDTNVKTSCFTPIDSAHIQPGDPVDVYHVFEQLGGKRLYRGMIDTRELAQILFPL